LKVWQDARLLTRRVYEISESRDFSRDFALRDQIRRAAISVMSNIAEGFESRTTKLFIDLLGRAKGSVGEVRSQLYVALDRGYIERDVFMDVRRLAGDLSRQISGFLEYLDGVKETYRVRDNLPDLLSDYAEKDS
jgi:four helix bundle protein